jgi:hypothetical protein
MSDEVREDGAVEQAAPTSGLPVKQDYGSGINIVLKHAEFDGVIDMSKLSWRDSKDLNAMRKAAKDGTLSDDAVTEKLEELIRKLTGCDPDDLAAEVVDKIVEVLFVGDQRTQAAEKN